MNASRTVVFFDGSFPYEGQRPNVQAFKKLRDNYLVVDADNLAVALADADVLVHLHGSYFPKAAWNAVLAQLSPRCAEGVIQLRAEPGRRHRRA